MLTTLRSDRARALLLALGACAVMLHALAGLGLMRSRTASAGHDFAAGICTIAAGGHTAPLHSHPANHRSPHDCCKLCAASGPVLLTDTALAVSPAPTFIASALTFAPARTASPAVTAHPPRGPPALA